MGMSSYSRKRSSSYSSYSESVIKEKTEMEKMLDLLEVVESNRRRVNEARKNVFSAQKSLINEENTLANNEKKVMIQLEKLDPETREILTRMMNGLNRTDGNVIRRDER